MPKSTRAKHAEGVAAVKAAFESMGPVKDERPLCLPSHVIDADIELGIGEIATDTETSGLFADDGARVSTASIAWAVDDDAIPYWQEWANRFSNVTTGYETIVTTDKSQLDVYILSVAWPFDQGRDGKPGFEEQSTLWADADNLDEVEWTALLGLLKNHDLIFQNGPFDLEKYRVGVRRWPGVGRELEPNMAWDTQNVSHMLWGLFPTSLKPTCARIFGKQWADEAALVKAYLQKARLPEGRWDLMPWDAIGKYADTDARITLMLKLRQEWEILHNNAAPWLNSAVWGEHHGPLTMANRRLATSRVLYRMVRRGVPYDEVTSRQMGDECKARAKPLLRDLPFAPATRDKAVHFFFTDGKTNKGVKCLDMMPYSTTPKGQPQLTAEIVDRMIDDQVPYAREWGDHRRVTNAASMWYDGYADAIGPDGRLRCAFRQNGTRSSRFSVERVNLQAIPQDYRLSEYSILDGILTPRQIIANSVWEGWRLFELDLAQAELRVGTMFAKCVLMEQMIRDGEDLHDFTTQSLFPSVNPKDPLFKSKWRQVGKRGNFSLQFGAQGTTFRKMVSKETGIILTDQEATRIVRDWNGLYPEFSRAIERHQRVLAKRQAQHGYGWIDAINGERRWFQEYEEAHKAFNQRVQLNLAQFGIDWMLQTEALLNDHHELAKRAKKAKIGEAGLVLTIHDSQVLLLPDDDFGKNLAAQCAQFGKDLWKQWFPGIPGDVDYHAWEKVAV